MITLTEALDPTLRRILEEDQQANFIWNLENYMSSYIHFLLCSIFTTLFIILAIWGASKIIKYWHSDPIRSHELQRWLQVESKHDIRTVESKVNKIVKGSTVRYFKNQVILKIPTKGWRQGYEHIDCQSEVRRRLDSSEFRELLRVHYAGYRFGDIVVHQNCYVIKGEAY